MAMTDISERQLEIIEAAGKLLSDKGILGLTTKNLAREMGFSESALYRHFNSKEDIIATMLAYLADSIETRLCAISSLSSDPAETLSLIFKSQFLFFQNHPYFVIAVLSDGLIEYSEKINQAVMRLIQIKISHLFPVIVQGQNCGQFRSDLSPDQLIHIIMGAFRLQMFQWRLSGFDFNLEEKAAELLETIHRVLAVPGTQHN